MRRGERYAEFRPRSSLLEVRNVAAQHRILTGFFFLFWLGLFAHVAAVLLGSRSDSGLPPGWVFFSYLAGRSLRTTAALVLLLSACSVVSVLAIALFFHNRLLKSAVVAVECFFCAGVPLGLCFHAGELPHWHRLFLSLFSMVLFMKIHAFFDSFQWTPDCSLRQVLADYVYFLLVPTLLFRKRHEYPKTAAIRVRFVAEKLLMTGGCLFAACVVAADAVHPIVRQRKTLSVVSCVCRLMLPMFMVDFLLFWAFFEGFCNVLAEATRFADRHFYEDWWNSGSFSEFARKWNRIVHCFLFRHLYENLHHGLRLKKTHASLLTFAFSSVMHELAMCALMGRMRGVVFAFQMLQIPLIRIEKSSFFKAAPLLSNLFVMWSLFVGPALLFVLYL